MASSGSVHGWVVRSSLPFSALVIVGAVAIMTLAVQQLSQDELESMLPGLPGVVVETSLYRPADFIASALDNLQLLLLIGLALGAKGAQDASDH
jgi:hypothetical protein